MSSHLLYVCELTFRSEIELKTQPPSSSERHAKRFQRKIKMPPAISIVTFGASASGVHLKPSILSLITTPPMLALAFAWTGPCSRHLRPKSNQREPASSSITKSISLSSVHPAALWHSATDRQTDSRVQRVVDWCVRARCERNFHLASISNFFATATARLGIIIIIHPRGQQNCANCAAIVLAQAAGLGERETVQRNIFRVVCRTFALYADSGRSRAQAATVQKTDFCKIITTPYWFHFFPFC